METCTWRCWSHILITAVLMVGRRYYANDMTSVTCEPLKTMTAQATFLPLSCFLYWLGEPKPTEKWSTYIKISEGSLSDLKKRFVLDGYGGFQDKVSECGIDKLDFRFVWSIKSPIRRISLVADFSLSARKANGKSTQILCWAMTEKNMSLSVSFPGFCISSVIRVR